MATTPVDVARGIPVDMLMQTRVTTTNADVPAWAAARLIEKQKLGCLPVVDHGRLVGIVTEADFVALACKHLEREAEQK